MVSGICMQSQKFSSTCNPHLLPNFHPSSPSIRLSFSGRKLSLFSPCSLLQIHLTKPKPWLTKLYIFIFNSTYSSFPFFLLLHHQPFPSHLSLIIYHLSLFNHSPTLYISSPTSPFSSPHHPFTSKNSTFYPLSLSS